MNKASPAASGTRTRILDAAERLFAERGFAAASLRAVIAAARVNLAAVHYHFGSKNELVRAVFARRLAPLNRKRLDLLDACERAAGRRPPPLARVLEAFTGPFLRASRDPARGGPVVVRLLGRTMTEPSPLLHGILAAEFAEVALRFTAAFGRAVPGLAPAEVCWRLHFAIGSLAHAMAMPETVAILSRGRVRGDDPEACLARLIPFLAAGMRGTRARTDRRPAGNSTIRSFKDSKR